jgi:hypothetical protein
MIQYAQMVNTCGSIKILDAGLLLGLADAATRMADAPLGELPSTVTDAMAKAVAQNPKMDEIRETFYRMADEANIFVFEPEGVIEDSMLESETIDLPFEVCSFEVRGEIMPGGYRCVLMRELEPRVFEMYCYKESSDRSLMIEYVDYRTVKTEGGVRPAQLVSYLLKRLTKERTGLEEIKLREKIGTGKERRPLGIRKIIRVAPDKRASSVEALAKKAINWSHRWMVRGHWRKHEGIGKNRQGDYVVSGWTWVASHQKGPEELPLIDDKTRLVLASKPEE